MEKEKEIDMEEYIRLKDVLDMWPEKKVCPDHDDNDHAFNKVDPDIACGECSENYEINKMVYKCLSTLNFAKKIRIPSREELIEIMKSIWEHDPCNYGDIADAILKAMEVE